jgi:serine/threonine protein kinase
MNGIDTPLPGGYLLNEYRLDAVLGAGGFGVTYLATDRNLNLKVALKEYLPVALAARGPDHSISARTSADAESFDKGLQRFLDEARTLASFHHPNIVRVMRFFESNNTGYMVMEFVEGQPLHTWINGRRPVAQADVLRIAGPLLDGLGVMHNAGYIHRDIKPANIYIRADGSPVLIDFGSARSVTNEQTLTAMVTPGYAPLEQYHAHGKQGPWSDLYALGGVMYWMITGAKPLDAATRVREDIMTPASAQIASGLYSIDLLVAIDWALKPHGDERPQNVTAFRESLSLAGTDAGWRPAALGKPLHHLAAGTRAAWRGARQFAQSAAWPRMLRAIRPAPRVAANETAPERATSRLPESVSSRVPDQAAAPAAGAGPTTTVTTGPFESDLVRRIESEAARVLGPIASVIVRNAARKATTVSELCLAVAQHIDDDGARAAFQRKFTQQARTGPPTHSRSGTPSPSSSISTKFSAEILKRAETELARHIGAVAGVVIRRAAAKARDESELYLLIAEELDDPAERKAFVRKAVHASRTLR